MRLVGVAVIVLAAPAAAAPGPELDLRAMQMRTAHDAAVHGHCDVVVQLAHQVEADTDYYQTTFLADRAIASCVVSGSVPPQLQARTYAALTAPSREEPNNEVPPANGGRILGELVLGSLTSAATAYVGARIAHGFGTPCMGEGDSCDSHIDAAIPGAMVGLVVGAPLGVYLVGTAGDETGSLVMTCAGSLAGTVAGLTLILADSREIGTPRIVAAAAMPVIGATLGFHVSRRYDSAGAGHAIVPIASSSAGRTVFGVAGSF